MIWFVLKYMLFIVAVVSVTMLLGWLFFYGLIQILDGVAC